MLIRTPSDLGALVRERRKALGLDQAELANRIGASRQWIVSLERGHPRAELALVLRTLDTLGAGLKWNPSASITDPTIDAIVKAAKVKP
jgi:HTH-type transcriptional regulator/antitoxin HipB